MRGVETEALTGGVCHDLLPEVVDKYLFATSHPGFSQMVGKAICQHCPIQAGCLEETIIAPPGIGMRGGQSNADLWRLHDRWRDEHVDADVLAAEAIARQCRIGGLQMSKRMRYGDFTSPSLAFPEMGGGDATDD